MEAALALEGAVHACTDVTGFGLLGHLRNMLEGSGVAARVQAGAVPLLSGARDLAARGAVPGGTVRNLEAAGSWTTWAPDVPEPLRILLCDAQTSGGLLFAVAATDEAAAHRELALRGITGWTVGEIVAGAGTVEVT
jgi:selenide,water dikinase